MTQEEFWRLYESKGIACKCYRYENPAADNGELAAGEVLSFEYGNMYYLRICENYSAKGYRKHYRNGGWNWATLKEFKSKAAANAYFKKAFSKYSLTKI